MIGPLLGALATCMTMAIARRWVRSEKERAAAAATAAKETTADKLPPHLGLESTLTADELISIASFLDGTSLSRLALCSKRCHDCAKSPQLWKELVRRELGCEIIGSYNADGRHEGVPKYPEGCGIEPQLLYQRVRGALAAHKRFYQLRFQNYARKSATFEDLYQLWCPDDARRIGASNH